MTKLADVGSNPAGTFCAGRAVVGGDTDFAGLVDAGTTVVVEAAVVGVDAARPDV